MNRDLTIVLSISPLLPSLPLFSPPSLLLTLSSPLSSPLSPSPRMGFQFPSAKSPLFLDSIVLSPPVDTSLQFVLLQWQLVW